MISENPIGWTLCVPGECTEGDNHLIPENDIKEHVYEETCPCVPYLDYANNEVAWFHNAYDQRGSYGRGRKLN